MSSHPDQADVSQEALSRFFYYPNQILRTDEPTANTAVGGDSSDANTREKSSPSAASRPTRRRPHALYVAILSGLVLIALGGALVWAGRQPPSLSPRVHWDPTGQQVLTIGCPECREGSSLTVHGKTAPLVEGAASVTLDVPLPVGESLIAVAIQLPDGVSQQPPLATMVMVPFWLRPDHNLDGSPVVRWSMQMAPGVQLEINRKPILPDMDGKANYEVDLSSECTGSSSEKAVISRTIHYAAFRNGQLLDEGEQTMTATVVPLEVTTGAVSGHNDQVLVKGHTLEEANATIEGISVPLQGGGFELPVSLTPLRTLTVTARAAGLLTRTVHVPIRGDARGPTMVHQVSPIDPPQMEPEAP